MAADRACLALREGPHQHRRLPVCKQRLWAATCPSVRQRDGFLPSRACHPWDTRGSHLLLPLPASLAARPSWGGLSSEAPHGKRPRGSRCRELDNEEPGALGMKHDTSRANLLPVPSRLGAIGVPLACFSSCGIPLCLQVTSPRYSLQPTGKS